MSLLGGKVAVVTGAGNGLGREMALELARGGASVVVNDLGVPVDGAGPPDSATAEAVVGQIRDSGGVAVANGGDVGDWSDAADLVGAAIETFGRLDILVNNAGILRRGSMLDLSENDLEALVHVHLKGTLATMHHAGRYWRSAARSGAPTKGSVINLTSRAGLEPRFDILTWYGAVKSGVALASLAAAAELSEFGIRVNAIAPVGATRMADFTFANAEPGTAPGSVPTLDQNNVPPVVAWLASDQAEEVTGQVFLVEGESVTRYRTWQLGESATNPGRWSTDLVAEEMARLIPST